MHARFLRASLASLTFSLAAQAQAQAVVDWPERPITLVVPFGVTSDKPIPTAYIP